MLLRTFPLKKMVKMARSLGSYVSGVDLKDLHFLWVH